MLLLLAIALMGLGGGVTYRVQLSKLRAEFAARVPARPTGSVALPKEVPDLETRIAAGEVDAWAQLGELYREAGSVESAREAFVTMAQLDSANAYWQLMTAETEVMLKRDSEAEIRIDRARSLGLPDGESYWRLGRLSEAVGQQVDAKADYERAVELDPSLDQVWGRLITLYRAIGDEGAARRALEKGLSASPDSVRLLMDRGTQARGRGQWDKAMADFSRVVELAPDELVATYALAQVLFQMKRKTEGEALLSGVLEKDPQNKTALMLLCVESLVAGDRAAVDRWYARIRSLADFTSGDRAQLDAAYRREFGEALPD